MKDAERLKVALAEMAAGAEASAARIAELEVERERSGEWVSAWHNLDRVMVEFGMDKKAQPQEAEVWLRGRLLRIAELERELAALKDALILDASQLGAAQLDEYTNVAVASSEAAARWHDDPCDDHRRRESDITWRLFRALYDARKRGDASAEHLREVTKKVDPAPADERVTLYIPEFQRGMSGLVYSSSERSRVVDVKRWIAFDARVVREGGAA